MSSTWGQNSWGDNSWQSNTVTITPTGQSSTSSVGQAEGFNLKGWGGTGWSVGEWGEIGDNTVELTGVSAKSQTAVVLSATGVTLVSAFPYAVYPDPDTSFDVV